MSVLEEPPMDRMPIQTMSANMMRRCAGGHYTGNWQEKVRSIMSITGGDYRGDCGEDSGAGTGSQCGICIMVR